MKTKISKSHFLLNLKHHINKGKKAKPSQESEKKLKELILLAPLEYAQKWDIISFTPAPYVNPVLYPAGIEFYLNLLKGHYPAALDESLRSIRNHPSLFTHEVDTITMYLLGIYVKIMLGSAEDSDQILSRCKNELCSVDDDTIRLRVHHYLGKIFSVQRHVDLAIAEMKQAFELSLALKDAPFFATSALSIHGLYREQNEINKAFSILETACNLQTPQLPPIAMAQIIFNILNLKAQYHWENDLSALCDQIIENVTSHYNQEDRCHFIGTLGSYLIDATYADLGTTLLYEAIDAADAQSLLPESIFYRIKCGQGHSWLAEHNETWGCFQKAKMLLNEYESNELLLLLLTKMTNDHVRKKALTDARDCLQDSINIANELENRVLQFFLLDEMYNYYLNNGQHESARSIVQDYKTNAARLRIQTFITNAALYEASMLKNEKDLNGAMDKYSEVFYASCKSGDLLKSVQVSFSMADILFSIDHPIEAQQSLQIITAFLTSYYLFYPRIDRRLKLQQENNALLGQFLANGLLLAKEQGEKSYLEDVFNISQMFKNKTLTDIMVQRLSQKKPLKVYEKSFVANNDGIVRSEEHFRGTRITSVFQRNQNLYPIAAAPHNTKRIIDVQTCLSENDIFLECFSCADSFILLPISAGGPGEPYLCEKSSVHNAQSGYHNMAHNIISMKSTEIKGNTQPVDDSLSELFGALKLNELLNDFTGSRPVSRLIIEPDSAMSSIPFHALRNPDTKQYLADTITNGIELWPSASLFVLCSKKEKKFERCLIISPENDGEDRTGMDELNRISALCSNPVILQGKDASIENITHHCPQADVVYFIGHGVYEKRKETFDIFLKLYRDSLFLSNMYNNQILLQAGSTVLLNCCNVAQTYSDEAGEFHGMVRAFFNSGATSIVSCLWPIENVFAAQYMPLLFKNLSDGNSLSYATKKTLDFLRNEWDHPQVEGLNRNPLLWGAYQAWGH